MNMKTLIAIFFALGMFLASLVTNGQSKSDKMYNAFESKDGITNFSFSKNMIDAINIDLGDDDEKQSVTGDLHEVRLMSYNPKKGNSSGSDFTKKAIDYLPKVSYKKFESDEDDDSEIWLLGRKKKFRECHVFTKSDNDDRLRFVVSFYGNFNVNDIDGLKEKGAGISASND